MFEKLMRLYAMSMAYDVRSPMPHLVGPPGSGKSSVIEDLAGVLGVELHIINVSRLSPLEIEGVQMPHGQDADMHLRMLPATFWTSLKEGDILLMDEFLRGFPEVYSGLLDIFTSRRVGAYRLPKVFIIGASNSVIAYDHALEDRLLHIPVPDPRTNVKEQDRLSQILIDRIGLFPEVLKSQEMQDLMRLQVLPAFDILDAFKKKGNKARTEQQQGVSLRNLIGQAQLKLVKTTELRALIEYSNIVAMNTSKAQYVVLLDGKKNVPSMYEPLARKLVGNKRLTEVQALNLTMNLQLIEMQQAMEMEDE